MFRAVIKNAGLEDQSTIFILEICFSYQEIQVSRPNVNSVTQSTISMRNGLPLTRHCKAKRHRSCGAAREAAQRPRRGLRGAQPGPGAAPPRPGPTRRGGARRRRPGCKKSWSLESSSRGAEARGERAPPAPMPAGALPATAGGGVGALPPPLPPPRKATCSHGGRGAQTVLGWMVTGDLKTADIKREPPSSWTGVFNIWIFQIQVSLGGSLGPGLNARSIQ